MISFAVPPTHPETERLTITSGYGNCVIVYRLPTLDELDEDQWRVAMLRQSKDEAAARSALNRSRRQVIVLGWEGICDPNGEAVPFTQDCLVALMLRVAAVEIAIMGLLEESFSLDKVLGEPVRPREPSTAVAASPAPGTTQSASSKSKPTGNE